MQASAKLYFLCFLALCLCIGIKTASIVSHHKDDGFWLADFMPGRTFSYGVVPTKRGEEMTLNFYDVSFPSGDCEAVRVDVYDDGYVKAAFNRIAVLCGQADVQKFGAVSDKGFHVVVTMGTHSDGGTLKARFKAPNGIRVTNEVLF